jgi:hypothetical protein
VLIGLGHTARVGKDTVARILVKEHGFTRLAFADVLRAVAYESNPSVRRHVDLVGWESAKTAYPEDRDYLVALGNACRRRIGEDVWVNAVFDQLRAGADYVISDVRYPNELHRVTAEGGISVRVTRPGVEPLANIADRALAGFTGWDATIENNGTIDELQIVLKAWLESSRFPV